jgi:hypothetical protein
LPGRVPVSPEPRRCKRALRAEPQERQALQALQLVAAERVGA